jgi:hypothetical protein
MTIPDTQIMPESIFHASIELVTRHETVKPESQVDHHIWSLGEIALPGSMKADEGEAGFFS